MATTDDQPRLPHRRVRAQREHRSRPSSTARPTSCTAPPRARSSGRTARCACIAPTITATHVRAARRHPRAGRSRPARPELLHRRRQARDQGADPAAGQLDARLRRRHDRGRTRRRPTTATTWTPLAPIGPETWSFWRIKDDAAACTTAPPTKTATRACGCSRSTDGLAWTMGAPIYDVAADTPLETELVFMPSGQLLALVRMDGTDDELLGNVGRLRTKVCWADAAVRELRLPADARRRAPRRPGRVAPRRSAVRRRAQALHRGRRSQAHGALRDHRRARRRRAGDRRARRAARRRATRRTRASRRSTTIASSSPGTRADLAEDGPWARAILGPTDIWQATINLSRIP